MYDTILVGTDGSDDAGDAVSRAIEAADSLDADLHAITVVNTKRYGEPALSSKEAVLNELESRGNDQLNDVVEQAAEVGLDVETDCQHGDPCSNLLDYADEIDADLIVLGSKGRTHAASKIGSTANRVIRESDREVLLV